MNWKYQAIGITAALLISFAFGRYSVSAPPAVKIDTSAQTDIKEDKDTHTHTTIEVTKEPDGVVHTVKTIDQETVSEAEEKQESQLHETITLTKRPSVNVSALIAEDFHNWGQPTYGISISKEFVGPITLGAFGLTNGTIGISIGVNF